MTAAQLYAKGVAAGCTNDQEFFEWLLGEGRWPELQGEDIDPVEVEQAYHEASTIWLHESRDYPKSRR